MPGVKEVEDEKVWMKKLSAQWGLKRKVSVPLSPVFECLLFLGVTLLFTHNFIYSCLFRLTLTLRRSWPIIHALLTKTWSTSRGSHLHLSLEKEIPLHLFFFFFFYNQYSLLFKTLISASDSCISTSLSPLFCRFAGISLKTRLSNLHITDYNSDSYTHFDPTVAVSLRPACTQHAYMYPFTYSTREYINMSTH